MQENKKRPPRKVCKAIATTKICGGHLRTNELARSANILRTPLHPPSSVSTALACRRAVIVACKRSHTHAIDRPTCLTKFLAYCSQRSSQRPADGGGDGVYAIRMYPAGVSIVRGASRTAQSICNGPSRSLGVITANNHSSSLAA